MKLEALLEYDKIVIQCHDDPDADAIASGFALQKYLESKGKNPRLVYSGPRKIKKGNLVKMVKLFDIGITHIEDPSKLSDDPPELLITVDCQDGESNVTTLPRRELASIDHHNPQRGVNKVKDTLREVRSDYRACSTILWTMLKDASFELDPVLSAALYYGLYMDTVEFQSMANAHPKDREMRQELEAGNWDRNSIERLKRSNLSAETLRIFGKAITELHIYKDYHFAVAQAQSCDPNILGIISDKIMEVDEVDLCVSYCLLPEDGRKPGAEFKFSVRSYLTGISGDALAKYIANGLGGEGAGGENKAGGTLSEEKLKKLTNMADVKWDGFNSAVGRLIYRKIAEYCENSNALREAYPEIAQRQEDHTYIQQLHDQAEQGVAAAQNNLGYYYRHGKNVEQDFEQAAKWFHRAAEQGVAGAQHNLGLCYYNGEGVERNLEQAVKWMRKAAEQGLAESQYDLGFWYANGEGVDKDPVQASRWYRKSAEQGYSLAQCYLGMCYYFGGEVEQQDFTQAAEWFRKAAEQGLADAQLCLGRCFYNGNGVEHDLEQAAAWFYKAAEQGHAEAQYTLGIICKNGDIAEPDPSQAAEWFRRAAEQGLAEAQYNLGLCYANGDGVEADSEQAVAWFRKAAEQGHANAQYNLGLCYEDGDGVEADSKQAVAWYRKAAEQGLAEAQYNLGVCYAKGYGVEADAEQAVAWYRKAAEQGVAEAQYGLGVCYADGDGVEADSEQAVAWYRKAAEQGHAKAQCNLGICYANGDGVEADSEQAVAWFRKAAEQGHAEAKRMIALLH